MITNIKTYAEIHSHPNRDQGDKKNLLSKIKKVGHSSLEAWAFIKWLAAHQGRKIRKEIRISTILGVIHTRIKIISNLNLQPDIPLSIIRSNMTSEATYDSLTIKNGRENLDVLSIKDGEPPKTINALMSENALLEIGAFINGGFFVHREGLLSATCNNCPVGFTVGETKGKKDVLPVPRLWEDLYGAVTDKNEKVLLCSAPVLKKNANFESDRFKYRVVDKSQKPNGELVLNPLNKLAGSLTHFGNANERAAISMGPIDVIFHTLTTKDGKRETGMKMHSWSKTVTSRGAQMEHLNLDGAASITMGLISKDGTKKGGTKIENISKGGGADIYNDRPIANLLITSPN